MNRLKELRKEKGLTQKNLSKEIGIPLRTIQNWENGESNIKPEKAELLAEYFNVQVPYLLGYSKVRYGAKQIEKAIKEDATKHNKTVDNEQLENTIKICEVASFLDMDIELIIQIYDFNSDSNNVSKVETLEDLLGFFQMTIETYNDIYYDLGAIDGNSIGFIVDKLEQYGEKLQDYLVEEKIKNDFYSTTGYPLSQATVIPVEKVKKETEKLVSAFNTDFIEFLKYHDLYLSNNEIEKVVNIMYSYSNANDLYLSSLIRDKNLKELRQQKEKDFSELFKYSSLWEMNYKSLEKNNTD